MARKGAFYILYETCDAFLDVWIVYNDHLGLLLSDYNHRRMY